MWLPPDRSLAALLLLVATINPAIAASVSLANVNIGAHQLNTGLLTCVWHEQPHHKPASTSDSTARPQTQANMAAELVAMGFSEHRAQQALLGTKGDVEQALEWLLNHSEDAPTEHTSDDARMDDGEVGPRSQPPKRRFGRGEVEPTPALRDHLAHTDSKRKKQQSEHSTRGSSSAASSSAGAADHDDAPLGILSNHENYGDADDGAVAVSSSSSGPGSSSSAVASSAVAVSSSSSGAHSSSSSGARSSSSSSSGWRW